LHPPIRSHHEHGWLEALSVPLTAIYKNGLGNQGQKPAEAAYFTDLMGSTRRDLQISGRIEPKNGFPFINVLSIHQRKGIANKKEYSKVD
jgi:hypothetical protein